MFEWKDNWLCEIFDKPSTVLVSFGALNLLRSLSSETHMFTLMAQSHLINIFNNLADNPGDIEDEVSSSSNSKSIGSNGNNGTWNGATIEHLDTPEPENGSIQVLSPPPTASQKHKCGSRLKNDVYYVLIIVLWMLF